MTKETNLAIVIPYYKKQNFEEVLLNLVEQTDQRFNLYIGNDASPENPIELIQKYSKIIKEYKFFAKNVGGRNLTKQWERCIHELCGNEEWIMLLCDDDLISKNVVEEFYNSLEEIKTRGISVVKYATSVINEDGSEIIEEFKNEKILNSFIALDNKILGKSRSTLSEHIFKKSAFSKHRFKDFELAFGSDDVAWIDFTEGGDIFSINEAVVYYRKSELSISNNPSNELKKRKMRGIIDSYLYILNTYSEQMNSIQKFNLSRKIYHLHRALYYNNSKGKINFNYNLLKVNGLKSYISIVKNNKDYYEK